MEINETPITPAEILAAVNHTLNLPLLITKPANQTLADARKQKVPNQLFGTIWHEGELCILFSDTNLGKSALAVQIAESIASGTSLGPLHPTAKAQPVLYFDFEMSEKQFEARYSVQYKNHYLFSPNLYRSYLNPDAMTDDDGYALSQAIEQEIQNTSARILIIDNLTYLRNETERAKDALPLMRHLKQLKSKHGLSILALAHTPKRDMSRPLTVNDLQGSKMLANFADSLFAIGASGQGTDLRYVKQLKARATAIYYDAQNALVCRIKKPYNFLCYEFVTIGSESQHLQENEGQQDETRLIKQIQTLHDEGKTQRDIAEALGIGLGTVCRKLKLKPETAA